MPGEPRVCAGSGRPNTAKLMPVETALRQATDAETELRNVRVTATSSSSVEGLRLFVVSLALTLGIVAQDAGRMATDTKLDLVVDPARFLTQALSMWDPLGDGGRLQNQAYGYLFPMGPFFAFADMVDVPPWATQRLWESALLVSAFLGAYHVARALGVARFGAAVGAGLAYALTPRVLAEITFNSAELLPSMILPWVLLPLVRGAERGSPRRAAALSGIALLFAGGTNAGATLAILPVPLVWLLTRASGPRRTALLRWSAIALPLATIWWVVPLVVLGRYSPPFLNWIEAAENTTVATSLLAALRGVPHWVTYLGPEYWPAGWSYVATPALIVATVAVAAAGLAGLARRDVPHRLFLFSSLSLGLIGVTFGHAASVGPVFAETARSLLDGPLVPFRNVHKFQGLITLPLAVGLGFALDQIRIEVPDSPEGGIHFLRFRRLVLIVVAMSIGALAVGPALGNGLVTSARDEPVAGWWADAAQWLAENSEGSRALIVPGAPFPTYLWGETVDDAMQPVAQSPWVVRSAVPLAQPGLIRLLDVVEHRLALGRSDPALASLLTRAGIGFVVIRHDLDSIASNANPQSLIRSTLEASTGFERAGGLGPRIGEVSNRGWLVDGGAGGPRPAIEIYEVEGGARGPMSLLSAEGTIRSNGSSDALASLVDLGLPATTPVLFGSDGLDSDFERTVAVATEGVRRQQDAFGGPFRRSGTMSASEPFDGERAVFDYLPDDVGALSSFRFIGVEDITSSSSGADVRAVFNADPTFGAWSAFDSDPDSAWRSAAWRGAVGEWLEVTFTEPVHVGSIEIAFAEAFRPFPARLEITTDAGSTITSVRATSSGQILTAPAGETTTLRLTVRAIEGGGAGASVGIANLVIPGVHPQRTLDIFDVGSPAVLRFAIAPGYRADCLAVPGGVACDPAWAAGGEEDSALDRSITLDEPRSYAASATVRLRPGPELERVLDAGVPVQARATSVDSTDPRRRAGAAVDGDPETAWVAASDDGSPTLSLDLGGEQEVRALRIVTNLDAPISRPTVVWVHAGDQNWIGPLPRHGLIRLPSAAMTDTVAITVVEAETRRSISMLNRSERLLPVGINEVRLDPAPVSDVDAATMVEFDCDDGLAVVIDGTVIPLSVSAETSEVLAGASVDAEPCDEATVALSAGQHRLTLAQTTWAAPEAITLSAADISEVHRATGDAVIEQWDPTSRRVRVDAAATSILVVHENFNKGWNATLNGQPVETVRVDGWQQGFVVPSRSAGVVEMTYTPQRAVVAGLVVGAAGVPALLTLTLLRPRGALHASVSERVLGVPAMIGLTLFTGLLLAGPVGLITIAAVLLVVGPLVGRASLIPRIAGPALLATAGVIVATAPSNSMIAEASSPIVQTLSVVAVAITFLAGIPRHGRDP